VASAEEGVYYSRQDYAGFFRRLGIDLIDIFAAFVVWFCLTSLVFMLTPGDEPPLWPAFLFLVVVGFGYFVLLKRSAIGTLGYKLCRAQIVNFQGVRPGIPSLTLRFLFSVFGPLNFLLDLFWIPSDKQRQALRDKFAHTYVVKAGAQPEGRGSIVYNSYHILGGAFIFAEVRTDARDAAP
jgi:uncharacterized RDD family membrane protein YckC